MDENGEIVAYHCTFNIIDHPSVFHEHPIQCPVLQFIYNNYYINIVQVAWVLNWMLVVYSPRKINPLTRQGQ